MFIKMFTMTILAFCMGLFLSSGCSYAEDDPKSELPVYSPAATQKADNEYRILFVGDSITSHGFSAGTIEKLKWDHQAGMAASSEDKDFAHLFAAKVQALMPDKKVVVFLSGPAAGHLPTANRLEPVLKAKIHNPHLVVLQHGEHEHQANGEARLRETYEALLTAFDDLPERPKMLCVGVWNPVNPGEKPKPYAGWTLTINNVMKEMCQAKGIPFVSVESAALDPACSGTGGSWGVRWHPNDLGHQKYAELLFEAYQKNLYNVSSTQPAAQ